MELLIAYLIFELFTGFLAAETLALAVKDGFGNYNRGRKPRQAARDAKRLKTKRGRAWIAARGALADFWKGFCEGGQDHGRKAWERRKGLAMRFGRWVKNRWAPEVERVSVNGVPSGPDPSPEGPEEDEERCEHGVSKTTCPKCREAGASPQDDKQAPGDKPPAPSSGATPAPVRTDAPPTRGVPSMSTGELTAPKVVDFWDALAEQAQRQVELEQAEGLEVPGGADVVDRLQAHAAAAHNEFDAMIEAAGSTGHQTADRYKVA